MYNKDLVVSLLWIWILLSFLDSLYFHQWAHLLVIITVVCLICMIYVYEYVIPYLTHYHWYDLLNLNQIQIWISSYSSLISQLYIITLLYLLFHTQYHQLYVFILLFILWTLKTSLFKAKPLLSQLIALLSLVLTSQVLDISFWFIITILISIISSSYSFHSICTSCLLPSIAIYSGFTLMVNNHLSNQEQDMKLNSELSSSVQKIAGVATAGVAGVATSTTSSTSSTPKSISTSSSTPKTTSSSTTSTSSTSSSTTSTPSTSTSSTTSKTLFYKLSGLCIIGSFLFLYSYSNKIEIISESSYFQSYSIQHQYALKQDLDELSSFLESKHNSSICSIMKLRKYYEPQVFSTFVTELLSDESHAYYLFKGLNCNYFIVTPFDEVYLNTRICESEYKETKQNKAFYCKMKENKSNVIIDSLVDFKRVFLSKRNLYYVYRFIEYFCLFKICKCHKMSNNNSLVIKLNKGGHKFQIFVDRKLFNDFKEEKKTIRDISLGDVIASEAGEKVTDAALQSAFGSTDVWICMNQIALQGEPQYTVQERREMTEQKRKQIIEYICKTYIDGTTKLPHPAARIDNGMKTIKGLKIDLNVSVSKQGDDIVKQLKSTMSFVKNETHGFIYISLEASGKAVPVVRKWCEIRREKYTMKEYKAEVTFTTSTMSTFINELTNVTDGNFRFEDDSGKVLKIKNEYIEKTSSAETVQEKSPKKSPRGKKGKK